MRTFFYFFLILLFPVVLQGQTNATPALRSNIQFHYSNDFFTATDHYYTQGVRLELALPAFRFLRKTYLFPRLKTGADEAFTLAFNQQCFTPTSLYDDNIRRGDRPFAGAISLTAQRVFTDSLNQLRLRSELQLGGVGPCSNCEETQRTIHGWLDGVDPQGWQHQVRNAPLVNYSLQFEKGIVNQRFVNLTGSGVARVGTLYTNMQLELILRAGWMNDYFNPWQKGRDFRCWLVAGGSVIGVGYNASMQGGVYGEKSVYTISSEQINRLVWRADYGLEVAYKKLNVHYLFVDLSPEFKTGLRHRWGHCKVSVSF
ncbi:MAG: lipid A-modifier LpxR family protein [Bacteroidia bacterium]